jgi:hypothetical protein
MSCSRAASRGQRSAESRLGFDCSRSSGFSRAFVKGALAWLPCAGGGARPVGVSGLRPQGGSRGSREAG